MRIVVTGLLAQYPFGGVTWDYLHYLLGFRGLGHEVWYLEDSGAWPYDPVGQTVSADCGYNVAYLRRVMDRFGFGGRWIYRNAADGTFHGAGEAAARELVRRGDLLVNVSSAGWLRDYEVGFRHRMFIDGDPMFCQVDLLSGAKPDYAGRVRAHDSHFTFGLHFGAADCRVPGAGIAWKTTVQPVALEEWPVPPDEGGGAFTTVMNWASYAPVEWRGERYGQKDIEFGKFIGLPALTPQPLAVAMGVGVGAGRPTERLRAAGWTILDPAEALPDHEAYRTFLAGSRAEWSVAKHGYVKARTGWFSGRTACYLALGRPAVVQETGWSRHLPAGKGLLAFSTPEEAAAAIAAVNADYAAHRAAARALAERFFEAKKVCADLLAQAGIG